MMFAHSVCIPRTKDLSGPSLFENLSYRDNGKETGNYCRGYGLGSSDNGTILG